MKKAGQAIKNGTLMEERLESYLKLKKENEYAADVSEYLQTKTKKYKEISKINKRSRRNKSEY